MVRLPPPVRPLFPYLKPVYTAATRTIAPLSTALSRSRGTGLPTGWVATTEEAAASTGGRCLVARESETITREPPPGGPGDAVFAANLIETVPRAVVAELPGGRVLGPHRAVISGAGDLVQDLSYYFGTKHPREHPLFLHPFPPAAADVSGRLGVLATRGDANYYHFLVDALPRLAVLATRPEVEAPEQWYVPVSQPFHGQLLDLVGVAPSQRLDSDALPHVRAETLVLPSPPSMTVTNPPWVVGYLRAALLDPKLQRVPGRCIYVSRGAATNNRAVRNEGALIERLSGRGFEIIDPARLPVLEQIRHFAEAEVIVAPHGAALANLAFASPAATVVELFPAGCVVPDYWKLAFGVPGLRYRYLMGAGRRRTGTRSQLLVSDITVDLDALERILDDISVVI